MAFSQSTITDQNNVPSGQELLIKWASTSPNGTFFQVYLAHVLAWSGTSRNVVLPMPSGFGPNTPIDIGTVLPAERDTDFSSDLPTAFANRVTLAWLGGTYLAEDITGYNVCSSRTPGGSVDLTNILAFVPAYPAGILLDGFGMGGFGQGGFGFAASSYTYRTATLAAGVWTFAVQPVDAAANAAASPVTQTATIAAPPQPPAPNSQGKRLTYTYNSSTHEATLAWLASP